MKLEGESEELVGQKMGFDIKIYDFFSLEMSPPYLCNFYIYNIQSDIIRMSCHARVR